MDETFILKEIWTNEGEFKPEDQDLATVYVDFECGCWIVNDSRTIHYPLLTDGPCKNDHLHVQTSSDYRPLFKGTRRINNE